MEANKKKSYHGHEDESFGTTSDGRRNARAKGKRLESERETIQEVKEHPATGMMLHRYRAIKIPRDQNL